MNPFAEDAAVEESEGQRASGPSSASTTRRQSSTASHAASGNPFHETQGSVINTKSTPQPPRSDDSKRKNPFSADSDNAKNPFYEDGLRPSPSSSGTRPISSVQTGVGRNPFQPTPMAENLSNPFAASLLQDQQRSLTSSQFPGGSPSTLNNSMDSITQVLKLTVLEHRETGLRQLCVGDNLALVVSQSASTAETMVSRREMTSFSRSDGSIAVRDQIEEINMDPAGTYALMSVRASRTAQKEGIFFINPHDATLKARGPLSALTGVTAICWYEVNGESMALVASASGIVQTARFSPQGGLTDLNPFFALTTAEPIVSLVARPNVVLMMDSAGHFHIVNRSGDIVAHGEIMSTIGEKQEVLAALGDDDDDFWVLTRRGLYRLSLNINMTDSVNKPSMVAKCDLVFEQDSCFAICHTRLFVLVLSRHTTKQSNVVSVKLNAISKITLKSSTSLEKAKVSVHGMPPVGFARDEIRNQIWLLSERGVCQVEIVDEAKGAWKLYLNRALETDNEGDFARALDCCEKAQQRDQVLASQADWNIQKRKFVRAAELYSEIRTNVKSFEEVALSFSFSSSSSTRESVSPTELRERKKALRVFLFGKLNRLPEDKKTLRAMLCTWICEAFLDEMDQAAASTTLSSSELEHMDTVSAFCSFLGSYSQTLEPARDVVFHLILSHGRIDMLLVYAHLTKDYDRVVMHHMHRDAPQEAVRSMRDFAEQDPEAACLLYYKHSSTLIISCPDQLVDAWLAHSALDPAKLVPALSRYTENEAIRSSVIRYLEHCVNTLGIRDEAIHNLLLGAYSTDEPKLYHFIKRETSQAGGFCFDAGFALRLCSDVSPRSRINLLEAMNLPEEACKVALGLHMRDVAQKIAQNQATSRGADEMSKRLWILCCKDVLQDKEYSVKKALEVVRASEGTLAIEDLLELLPNSVKMDELRDEVCVALEQYNAEIEKLKSEMDEHTESAQALRRDAIEEKRRFDVVRASKSCDTCGRKIFLESGPGSMFTLAGEVDEFYVFPCTHIFHSKCLCNQVIARLHGDRRDRVSRLAVSDSEDDQALLEEIVGAACPLCGELMIQSVAQPLVFAKDEAEARLWE